MSAILALLGVYILVRFVVGSSAIEEAAHYSIFGTVGSVRRLR
jgi:hypothetical protein